MDQFMFDNFLQENPGIHFPNYEEIKGDEASNIKRNLIQKLGLPIDCQTPDIARAIENHQEVVEGLNAESEPVYLEKLFKSSGHNTLNKV